MKVFSVVVGASGACAMHLHHFTDNPQCTEKVAMEIDSASHGILDLFQHSNPADTLAGLEETYKQFQDVNQIADECRAMALELGPVTNAFNNTQTTTVQGGDCLADVKSLVTDASTTVQTLEKALKEKSIEDVLAALKDIKHVEADIAQCKADCKKGQLEVDVVVERTQCAKHVDAVVQKITTIMADLKAVVKDKDLTRICMLENEILDVPRLASGIPDVCSKELAEGKTMLTLELKERYNNNNIHRRSIFDTLTSAVQYATHAAVGSMKKHVCHKSCFKKAESVLAGIRSYTNLAMHVGGNNNNNNNTTTPSVVDHMTKLEGSLTHENIGSAIVACSNAHDNF